VKDGLRERASDRNATLNDDDDEKAPCCLLQNEVESHIGCGGRYQNINNFHIDFYIFY